MHSKKNPFAGGGPQPRHRVVLLCVIGLRGQCRQAARPECHRAARGGRYPALPEDGYGWEKLFSERMCRHFREDFGLLAA